MDRQPLLVGFHGVKRSGKDTAATYLEEWCRGRSLSFARRGFADKAKLAFARQFFPSITMPDAVAWVDKFKDHSHAEIEFPLGDDDPLKNHPSDYVVGSVPFRQCVAQFATEGARLIYGEDHWTDQLLPLGTYGPYEPRWWSSFTVEPIRYGNQIRNVAHICAITDLRFDNEVARIRALGGTLVKIRRTVAEDAVLAQTSIHESELGIPDQEFDYLVHNDGTLDDFRVLIEPLAEMMM